MEMRIYTVRDSKAQGYLQPFFMPNVSVAIRALKDCLADSGHQFAKHPEDYDLYCIGFFDDLTGIIEAEPPVHVVAVRDLYKEISK